MPAQPVKTMHIDQLVIQVYEHREKMGRAAARDVAQRMRELQTTQDHIRMVFASAPSQLEFFENLRKEEGIEWEKVIAFQMDEYIGLEKDHPQRFSQYLTDHLFQYVSPGKVEWIDSTNEIDAECKRYAGLLMEAPIDIVCLGIGENGHIAFNDPPFATFDEPEMVKEVVLDEVSRQQQVNDQVFERLEDVPSHAITLTIPALMRGEHLYCIVPGTSKTDAVQKTLHGPVTKQVPASILRTHGKCILYLDQAAYGDE